MTHKFSEEGDRKAGSRALTARQSEVALRGRVPALSHSEDDGPGTQTNNHHNHC